MFTSLSHLVVWMREWREKETRPGRSVFFLFWEYPPEGRRGNIEWEQSTFGNTTIFRKPFFENLLGLRKFHRFSGQMLWGYRIRGFSWIRTRDGGRGICRDRQWKESYQTGNWYPRNISDLKISNFGNNNNILQYVPDSCCRSISNGCGKSDHPSNIYYHVSELREYLENTKEWPPKSQRKTNFFYIFIPCGTFEWYHAIFLE